MALPLNLPQLSETLDDIPDKRSVKLTDILVEQRKCYNRMIQALNAINTELVSLKSVKEKCDKNEETLDDLVKNVVPEIKRKIDHDIELLRAKLLERIEAIEKERLLENAHRRRLHIIANGVPQREVQVGQSEPTEQVFRDLLKVNLKLPEDDVKKIVFRDVHRLPGSKKHKGPPPIIAAFICQRERNDVLAAAKELKGTDMSLKSDLPKDLNELRGRMLTEKYRLKTDEGITKVRLVERGYLPILQKFNEVTKKWDNIMTFDKTKPLLQALHPVSTA